MPRFPKKLKFLASRCPCCLSRGVPPRAVARIRAVPNIQKQAVCQNFGNTSIQGVAIYRSLWPEPKAPPILVSARFWQQSVASTRQCLRTHVQLFESRLFYLSPEGDKCAQMQHLGQIDTVDQEQRRARHP